MDTDNNSTTQNETSSFAVEVLKVLGLNVAATAGTLAGLATFGLVVEKVRQRKEKKSSTTPSEA